MSKMPFKFVLKFMETIKFENHMLYWHAGMLIGIRHLISHQTPRFCPIAFEKQKVLSESASISLILLGQEKI